MSNLEMSDVIMITSPFKHPAVQLPLESVMTPLESSDDVVEVGHVKRQCTKKERSA